MLNGGFITIPSQVELQTTDEINCHGKLSTSVGVGAWMLLLCVLLACYSLATFSARKRQAQTQLDDDDDDDLHLPPPSPPALPVLAGPPPQARQEAQIFMDERAVWIWMSAQKSSLP